MKKDELRTVSRSYIRNQPPIEGVKRTFFGKKTIIFANLVSFRGKQSRKEVPGV